MTGRRAPISALLVWLLLVAGCSSSPSSAPSATSSASSSAGSQLTRLEAERLASMRFNVYRHTGLHFHTTVTSAKGSVTLDGDVDYRNGVGYAAAIGQGAAFTLQWNAKTFVAWPAPANETAPPAELPKAKPGVRALSPTESTTDNLLALLLFLGQDRPDNAQLIVQDGGRFLRNDTVDGTPVEVLQGPGAGGSSPGGGSLNYWLTAKGQLLRVDASFGGSAPTEIDLSAASYEPFPVSAALRPAHH